MLNVDGLLWAMSFPILLCPTVMHRLFKNGDQALHTSPVPEQSEALIWNRCLPSNREGAKRALGLTALSNNYHCFRGTLIWTHSARRRSRWPSRWCLPRWRCGRRCRPRCCPRPPSSTTSSTCETCPRWGLPAMLVPAKFPEGGKMCHTYSTCGCVLVDLSLLLH